MRGGRVLLAGLLVAALTVACTGTGPSEVPGPGATSAGAGALPAELGVSAEMRQSRTGWADRVVQVRVRNDGPLDLTVTALRLRSPFDTGVATGTRERLVRAGVSRDVHVPLAPADCSARDPRADVVVVDLDLASVDGRTTTVSLHPADPLGHLARIHREDCAALAVAAGARLALDPDLEVVRDGTVTARVGLVVTPVEGGPRIDLDTVDGTVLYAPPGREAAWSLGVSTGPGAAGGEDDAGVQRVEIEVEAARCDPHAVAEDKRGTVFGVHARVDGVAQETVYLEAPTELRRALFDFTGEACGWVQE